MNNINYLMSCSRAALTKSKKNGCSFYTTTRYITKKTAAHLFLGQYFNVCYKNAAKTAALFT
jgi:hypothetical protein